MFKNLAVQTKEFFRPWPNRIFALVVLLFVAEASYLAIMNSYPMAYDESYHFGLIQFYSQNLNPFVSSQDASTYVYGNIVDNPSWLYHYLLSFPYRLLELTGSLRTEVTGLRMFSVAFVAASLVVLYRIAHQLRLPSWLGVLVVAIFALTPVVTVLSAQMNYDNLIIFITLACVSVLLSLFAQARTGVVAPRSLFAMISLVCFGSLVKFSFLPLALAFALATVGLVLYVVSKKRGQAFTAFGQSIRSANKWVIGTLAALTLLITSLTIGFYGQNVAQYKTPVPDCAQVLSVQACMAYSPWSRNYTLETAYQAGGVETTANTLLYIKGWVLTMTTQLFGNIAPNGGFSYADKKLLIVFALAMLVTGIVALLSIVTTLKTYPQLGLVLGIAVLYLAALFLRNYTEFLRFGIPTAIQGRYFAPVLAILYLAIAIGAYTWVTQRKHNYRLMQLGLATLVLGSMVTFGGAMSYASGVLPNYQWQDENNLQNAVSSAQLAVVTKPTEN
ncbi:MAG: hypothetical protein WAS36_02675 [Candidatus Saccharimonadales bacterium]